MTFFILCRTFKIPLLCIFFFILIGCENDDICSPAFPSTPLLIVRFYDKDNPDTLKEVPTLKIVGEGKTEPLENYNRVSTDSIAIPLKGFETTLQYILINASATDSESQEETGNSDLIDISYEVEEQFLYRGCGFVANYRNPKVEAKADDNPWIDSIVVQTELIVDEKQAHVKIYH